MGTIQDVADDLEVTPMDVCRYLASIGQPLRWAPRTELEPIFEIVLRNNFKEIEILPRGRG